MLWVFWDCETAGYGAGDTGHCLSSPKFTINLGYESAAAERLPRFFLSPLLLTATAAPKLLQFPAMKRRTWLQRMSAVPFLPMTGLAALRGEKAEPDSTTSVVYELRVYHTYEGKLEDLLRRFREHTTKLFERHGIKNVAYWTPTDDPLKGKTLIYILAHPSREAATANWKAFQDDPEWKSVRDKSEENGKIVEKVDSTFMTLTDFSVAVK